VVIGQIFLTPNEKKRVHRGGSFLCNDQYCSPYMVGFRCVKDPGIKTAQQ
jgi:hypothetical protein